MKFFVVKKLDVINRITTSEYRVKQKGEARQLDIRIYYSVCNPFNSCLNLFVLAMEKHYSIWLLPMHGDSEKLQSIIHCLASNNNTQSFPAHCTLLSVPSIDVKNQLIIDNIQPEKRLRAFITGIEFSSSYWKSVYFQLKVNNAFSTFQRTLARMFHLENHYRFDPHLSVAYLNSSIKKKSEIGDQIAVESIIQFDEICVVETGGKIENWRTIFTHKLGTEK